MNEYIFWIGFLKFSMKPYFPPCNERKSYWQENKYLTVNYLYKPQKRFNTLFEKLERARSLSGRQIQRRILEVSYIFTEKEDAVHARQIFIVKLSLEKHRLKKIKFFYENFLRLKKEPTRNWTQTFPIKKSLQLASLDCVNDSGNYQGNWTGCNGNSVSLRFSLVTVSPQVSRHGKLSRVVWLNHLKYFVSTEVQN